MQPRPPTYLFVLPWSLDNLGGVNQVVIGLAHEMRKSGVFDPLVLIADWSATTPVWQEVHGVRTVRWRIRSIQPGAGLKERLAFAAWLWRFGRAFRLICRERNVVAINPHYPGPSVFALQKVIRGMKVRPALVLSFHGADLTGLLEGPAPTKALWQASLQQVSSVVACSQSLGHRLAELFGQKLRAEVIHNGLGAQAFASAATPLGAPEGRTILNVAKFEAKKGQDVLIRAFSQLADRYPDLRLSLVGASAGALAALRQLCASLHLEDRVHFHLDVPHAQMSAHFQQATVFALSSRVEPFGIVLLEAGAFGLPVVASRVGGIPEILQHGVTGLLVPPDDVEELSNALRAILDDASVAKDMGLRLHRHVVSEFTWEAACRRYAALIPNHAPGHGVDA